MKVIGYCKNKPRVIKTINNFLNSSTRYGHTVELHKITSKIRKSKKAKLFKGDLYVLCGWNCVRDTLVIPKIIGINRLLISDSFMRPLDFINTKYEDNIHYSINSELNCIGSKYESLPNNRWKQFEKDMNINVKPWNVRGNLVVITYGTDSVYTDNVKNINSFKECIIACKRRGLDVVVCSHPAEIKAKLNYADASTIPEFNGLGCKFDVGADKYLEDVKCMISYPGSMNFKSVIMGIPTFPIMDCYLSNLYKDCNIYTIGAFLDNIPLPDRSKWLNWLAYQQWTYEEIERGLPWKFLIEDNNIQHDKV